MDQLVTQYGACGEVCAVYIAHHPDQILLLTLVDALPQSDPVFTSFQGARLWIRDPEVVWRGAVLLEDYKGQKELQVKYEDEEVSSRES
jgi:hypothetical protein